MKAICAGCGDEVVIGTGCCPNCQVGASKRRKITKELRDQISHAYWKADLKPKRIARITGVPVSRVKDICCKRRSVANDNLERREQRR